MSVETETLREAAALMRLRAEVAESGMAGPWESKVLTDGRAWVAGQFDSLSLHGYPGTAEHVASWHPLVVRGVADLLDALALDRELDPYLPKHFDEPALNVARAYLGRES